MQDDEPDDLDPYTTEYSPAAALAEWLQSLGRWRWPAFIGAAILLLGLGAWSALNHP